MREVSPQVTEGEKSYPIKIKPVFYKRIPQSRLYSDGRASLHLGKGAKSLTVGNAVLSVPKNKVTRRAAFPWGKVAKPQVLTDEG